jgi:ABC-type branched-subunit amino acid transport system ATPase component/branched-subunit amino acid ABC-type transport system permease component
VSSAYLSLGAAGLGNGAIYAALAIGLVLTYRGSGVINFSQGLMGLWAAFAYVNLQSGTLTLPLVGIPANIHIAASLPSAVAFPVAMLDTSVVAALVYLLVFRPLATRPLLGRIVASVGVLTTLQSLVVIRLGLIVPTVPPVFPTSFVHLGPLVISQDRLWLTVEVVAIAAGVAVVLKRTRIGTAVRAASESEAVLAYAGWTPARIGLVTWIGGALCTAAVAIPAAEITTLTPSTYPLLIIPALAAALVGGLNSVGVACGAGLALGVLQGEIQLLSTKPWWPIWAFSGVGDALPFVVIAVYLFVRGRSLPTRETLTTVVTPPFMRRRVRAVTVGIVIACAAAALVLTSGTFRFGLITSMIFAVACLSLVVITGAMGQISLAQLAVAGLAGFTLARLESSVGGALLAIALATAMGVVFGLSGLRIRGAQLAVVTLAAAFAVQQFVFGNPAFNGIGANITGPRLGSVDLSIRSGDQVATLRFGLLVLTLLTLCLFGVRHLLSGRIGRQLLAVKSAESAAAAIGIDVTKVKMVGLVLASALAGLSGVLLAYSQSELSSDTFNVLAGVSLITFAFLGGITQVSGAIFGGVLAAGGVLYVVLNRYIPNLGNYYELVSGVGVIAATILAPRGLAGQLTSIADRLEVRLRLKRRVRWGKRSPQAAPQRRGATADASLAPSTRPRASCAVEKVSVRYGGVRAVSDVHMTIEAGSVVGLIGPNGAGKSSLVDAIAGVTPYKGSVRLGEEAVDDRNAVQRSHLGIGRTWQHVELFAELTVRENLIAAAEAAAPTWRRDGQGRLDVEERVARAAAQAGLGDEMSGRRPDQLTAGQQKVVGLARCLAADPAVLLLDEPGAGLNNEERLALAERIREIARSGKALLLIDHDVALVMSVCETIYVLDLGNVIAHGTPDEIRSDPRVRDAYLGVPDDRPESLGVPDAGASTETLNSNGRPGLIRRRT